MAAATVMIIIFLLLMFAYPTMHFQPTQKKSSCSSFMNSKESEILGQQVLPRVQAVAFANPKFLKMKMTTLNSEMALF